MRFQTKLIHGNWTSEPHTGATNVPIYFSNSFAHKKAKELEDIFAGREFGYVYTRISNPSVEAFERRLAAVEGGTAATATASGMSAIYLALMNILQPNDEVIASSGIFGGTYNLLKNLKEYNIHVLFLDELTEETLSNAITDRTKLVFAETMGNPKLDVLDVEAAARVCQDKGVILMIDSTVTSPYLIKPLELGADMVIHSTSKYINGNSNSIGGVIIDGGSQKYSGDRYVPFHPFVKRFRRTAFTAKLRNGVGKDLGAVMSPMNSFLNLNGIETLGFRMNAHCQNAQQLAEYLEQHPKVCMVNYPGLKSSPYYSTTQRYYARGAGGILTCRLGSKEKAYQFIDRLKLITNLVNIGDAKSLIVHPASTICANNSMEEKEQMGVYEDLVRISVGIEDPADILEDVERGLAEL